MYRVCIAYVSHALCVSLCTRYMRDTCINAIHTTMARAVWQRRRHPPPKPRDAAGPTSFSGLFLGAFFIPYHSCCGPSRPTDQCGPSDPPACASRYARSENGHCWVGPAVASRLYWLFNVVPCPPSPAWFYIVGLERGG